MQKEISGLLKFYWRVAYIIRFEALEIHPSLTDDIDLIDP
jgi:hypothetical protein